MAVRRSPIRNVIGVSAGINNMNPNINEPELPARFGGVERRQKRHICGFFRTPEEEYELLLPFITEGLDGGEKAFHVVNPRLRGDHVRRLGSVGVDVESVEKS